MAGRNDNAPQESTAEPLTQNSPWLPVTEQAATPAKPLAPAVRPQDMPNLYPEPIESEDVDIIAAVTPPPPEEILPTDGRDVWESISATAPTRTNKNPADPVAQETGDPVRWLGDAALRQASLSAAGAPTPLGGVPSVALEAQDQDHSQAPSVSSATEPVSSASAVAPGFMPATSQANDNAAPTSPSYPELDDDQGPLYTPAFGTPTIADPAQPGTPGDDAADGSEPPTPGTSGPWWRSWPFLVAIGLLVMGGIAFAIIQALSSEETFELTTPVIVATPEGPALDPIAIEDPTAFQAALPSIVGTYALTGIEVPPAATFNYPVRIAEGNVLTYATPDSTLTLRAIQHFSVEDAVAQFEALALEGTDRATVIASGTEVGDRVTVDTADGQAIVWRNDTAIFQVDGPLEEITAFFAQFTL